MYKTLHDFSRVNQEKYSSIKRDEINIMNIINDDTFDLHNNLLDKVALSAGAVEYTDCIFPKG